MATWVADTNYIDHRHHDCTIMPFAFHAKNSMDALNKIRKWGRANSLEYGKDFEIKMINKDDLDCHSLHNEYLVS